MKRFPLFILTFLFIFLSSNVYSGPICGGPVGGSGQNPGDVVITGGTIDGTIIGGTTPVAGSFTTLEASTDPVDTDGVGDRGYNDLRYLGIVPSIFKLDHNVELLNADRTVLITDKPIQWYDCNGANRNVTLSAEASSTDFVFTFYNASDGIGEDLVIRDDTPATLVTIGPGQGTRVSCDGTSWKVWFNGIYYDSIGNIVRINDRLDLTDGTDTSIVKHVNEPGLGGRLTIGLDETARSMVICDAGDVDIDFGLIVNAEPRLFIFPAAGVNYGRITASGFFTKTDMALTSNYRRIIFTIESDNPSSSMFNFITATGVELTDTNGEQSFMTLSPKINQSATAAYNGLKIKVTETALGDASTGDGGGTNNLILAGTSTDPDMFKVENDGDLTMSAGKFSAAVMTFAFTTEVDITDPLTGSVVLLDGDNDSENDAIDLQDGTTIGQILYLIAAVDIDADDTCTINYGDTTCTNCPATVFNKVGESVHLIWTGSTWVCVSLQNAL